MIGNNDHNDKYHFLSADYVLWISKTILTYSQFCNLLWSHVLGGFLITNMWMSSPQAFSKNKLFSVELEFNVPLQSQVISVYFWQNEVNRVKRSYCFSSTWAICFYLKMCS